ncbi:WbqC family protein [Comamonas sp. CMM03]|nr:WbqC family protein [Comamonas sp. CMM03]MBV7419530.1 WbqC family protein [Comamonas sp. CMM03]
MPDSASSRPGMPHLQHVGGMTLGIMQPYFLPYIGYFQLIAAVDEFIVYDNIKYTKKGWINRNRLLSNGEAATFSLPLRKDSDALDIVHRELSESFDRKKLLNQFIGAYGKAPYFQETIALIQDILLYDSSNLFYFLKNSITAVCKHIGIPTRIQDSSALPIDHDLKSQDRVLAMCQATHATTYINPIGGVELYSRDAFEARGIQLKFIQSELHPYPQNHHDFVPWLSIVDVLMFNPVQDVSAMLKYHRLS